ncbi:hypothetical protein F7734_49175 [Scytonema sp. UIC 10036]|uniref:hypothetical protein n=1 Tax=Scytonema sp. UIC 10036 TaxID=2304196 RepID=UPI0012DA7184|nr:hypothetical protein [Scytonema sp. UIC 10036]MUG99828.1 hypothetical protein [Scytonema sp. UIC 10036]
MNPIKHFAKVGQKLSESQQIMQQVYLEFHLIEDFEGIQLGVLRELIEFHSMIWDRVFELMAHTDVRKYNYLNYPSQNRSEEWFPWQEYNRFSKKQELNNEQLKELHKKLEASNGEVTLSESELHFIIKAIEEKMK